MWPGGRSRRRILLGPVIPVGNNFAGGPEDVLLFFDERSPLDHMKACANELASDLRGEVKCGSSRQAAPTRTVDASSASGEEARGDAGRERDQQREHEDRHGFVTWEDEP